jgi:hypothetical protein
MIPRGRVHAGTATTVAAPRRSSQSPRGVRAIRTMASSQEGQRRMAPSSMGYPRSLQRVNDAAAGAQLPAACCRLRCEFPEWAPKIAARAEAVARTEVSGSSGCSALSPPLPEMANGPASPSPGRRGRFAFWARGQLPAERTHTAPDHGTGAGFGPATSTRALPLKLPPFLQG